MGGKEVLDLLNILPAIYLCVVPALAGGTLRLSPSGLQTSAFLGPQQVSADPS